METAASQTEDRAGAPAEHFDVLVVGAGISGIGAACHLRRNLPGRRFAILEARDEIGGTWDLFRYPGIRSDSDMHTLGYRFRPWAGERSIADGESILRYIRETAREYGIEREIRYRHRVVAASWSGAEARWTVEVEREDGERVRFSCSFLFVCGGYYRYDRGYVPDLPGVERFAGELIHPQHWPSDADHAGKRVVVIGSGATAVTLVPALARTAAHVTMLQRTPSYVVSLPATDPVAHRLRRLLPRRALSTVIRWKNVLIQMATYRICRAWPRLARRFIRERIRRSLPAGFDVDRHFNPPYDPWDQRLCLVPDSDLFEALSSGRASVVTDRIEAFTERGIRLRSGEHLEADMVVTATGFELLFLGGIELTVDGRRVDPASSLTYKGMMLNDVPNLAFTVGYTNASWTLKVDLVCEYVCRLLARMDAEGHAVCVPELGDRTVDAEPILDFSSGYVRRALDRLPKQGSRVPWRLRQNYALDLLELRLRPLDDGTMRFFPAATGAPERVAA